MVKMPKGLLIEEYMKQKENNEKEESANNALFANKGKISTEEDIKHMVEAMVPVLVMAVIFRISVPLKFLGLTMMNEKNMSHML